MAPVVSEVCVVFMFSCHCGLSSRSVLFCFWYLAVAHIVKSTIARAAISGIVKQFMYYVLYYCMHFEAKLTNSLFQCRAIKCKSSRQGQVQHARVKLTSATSQGKANKCIISKQSQQVQHLKQSLLATNSWTGCRAVIRSHCNATSMTSGYALVATLRQAHMPNSIPFSSVFNEFHRTNSIPFSSAFNGVFRFPWR